MKDDGSLRAVCAMFSTHDISSRYLGVTRRVTVWLPPGARGRTAARHPVLYLHDGQNLFDPARAFAGQTWRVAETAARLVRRPAIPPLIIVGIDHGGALRGREFLPVEDERNPDTSQPLGREHVEFVTREVMPAIARNYPVAPGATNTGIGGSSYGAVAALNAVLLKPGVFGRLLLESPSLYVGRQYMLRKARSARRWPSRVYVGVGSAETSRHDWNEETVENVTKLAAILQRAGLGPRRLRVVIEDGATHSETAWAGRLPVALGFLFGRARRSSA
jgi:predicted alpha/beta superfamily hydrolase